MLACDEKEFVWEGGDFDPLSGVTELKFYCPDVGLAREEFPEGFADLVSR